MDVLVSGSGGLVGGALVEALRARGDRPVRLVRPGSSDRPGETVRWDPTGGDIQADRLEGIDAVVHLAGEPLFGRWTGSKKRRIRESRVQGTTLLSRALAGLEDPPSVMLSASGVHWYGSRGDEVLTEESGPGSGFLAEVCHDWEDATDPAAEAGIRVVKLRTAPVQARDAEVVQLQAIPAKLGLGGKLGHGRQWFAWIALEDHVRAMLLLLGNGEASGPVNLVAPNPVRHRVYADTLAHVLNRPRFLTVPEFAVAAVFGRTMADEMATASQRVLPKRLVDEFGMRFRHPHIEGCLRDVFDRQAA